MKTGIVFKIQKHSIHDGPGIRTAVFLKGCPLDCWWCHNPEGRAFSPVNVYHPDKCIRCGRCVKVCMKGALYLDDSRGLLKDCLKCSNCSCCAEVCPCNALERIGTEMTVSQVMDAIERDQIFYDESGGGVTFTGGEPFMQFDFLHELLENCLKDGIHTAVETCGHTAWENLQNASTIPCIYRALE